MTAEQDDSNWHTLDVKTVLATGLVLLGVAIVAGVPTAIGLASWRGLGFGLAWVVPCALVMVVAITSMDYLRWRRTRYRVTDDAVDLHRGILFLSRRRLARERIRAVDFSAHPVLRIFGLVKVTIGTGEQGGGASANESIILDPVTRDTAEHLQKVLLDRDQPASLASSGRLATWRPAWIRYAPLSIATVIFVGAIVGVPFQIADWFGRGGLPVEFVNGLIDRYGPWLVIGLGIPVIVVAAALIATAFHAEAWWGYRLDREPGGTLRVRRGLLTTRSLSLEEDRIRGIDLIEPLGIRVAGAGRVQVVATGLNAEAEQKSELSTLLPAAPRATALSVAEQVCGERPPSSLTGHPIAARDRRIRWAVMLIVPLVAGWVVVGALTGWLAWWSIALGCVILLGAGGLILRAIDSYRNLGHGLSGEHLIARRGSIRRSTALLRRQGIIGWQVRRSIFQRRAGLATLVATTAAGRGHYAVADGAEGELLELAGEAVPDLLEPFLVRE